MTKLTPNETCGACGGLGAATSGVWGLRPATHGLRRPEVRTGLSLGSEMSDGTIKERPSLGHA